MKKKNLLIAAAGIAAIYCGGIFFFHNHFLPNTYIAGTNIGLSSSASAEKTLGIQSSASELEIDGDKTTDVLYGTDIDLRYDDNGLLDSILAEQKPYTWPLSFVQKQMHEASVTYNEEKLNENMSQMNCLTSKELTPSEDARIKYTGGTYAVIEEKYGDIPDKDELKNEIIEAIKSGSKQMTIDCYIKPSITSSSPEITEAMAKINNILNETITLTSPYTSYTLTKDDITSCIKYEDGTVEIDEDGVYLLASSIADTFNTVGKEKEVTTVGCGSFTISGGIYGYKVDTDKEAEQLAADILAGKDTERNPVYSQEETYDFNGGLGNTYIDVSIDEQKVWLVYAGEKILETDCVTGLPTEGRHTPTGIYWIEWKTTDYQMTTFNAYVNFWMPIDSTTGVGLHDASWRSRFGGSIYQSDGSHGCINLPYSAAQTIYNYAFGTMPVVVH